MTIFDRLIDEAWPAQYTEVFDGWRLRHAGGVTKRANSVWAAAEPGDPVKAIEAAERFYAERGLAPVFSVGPGSRPADLDTLLARRGYTVVDPTLVMTTTLAGEPSMAGKVRIADRPSDAWLDLWWSVDGRYPAGLATATKILTGVPASYASTGEDGCEGVGRSVSQGDWLGIYSMAVAPAARRRGLARDVLTALLDDGLERGAHRAYLCVTEQNSGARALYERAGFEVSGGYHYRVGPNPVS